MSDEIKRISVSGDAIYVYEPSRKTPPHICQCGHPKAMHSFSGTGACYHKTERLIGGGNYFIPCMCMTYVEVVEPKAPRDLAVWIEILWIFLGAVLIFAGGFEFHGVGLKYEILGAVDAIAGAAWFFIIDRLREERLRLSGRDDAALRD
jgi:hypothetical protein